MNWSIIEQVGIMTLLVAIGFFARKKDFLDEHTTKKLSTLVLTFATPMVILTSYQKPFDPSSLSNLLIAFGLALVSYALCYVLVPLIMRGKNKGDILIEKFACIYSNCAFMGIPLIEGVYGSDGVFYLTAYVTLFNICVWTHGVMFMQGSKFSFKAVGKALLSPCVIATFVGIILFLCNVMLPNVLLSTAKHLSHINTPLAMMIAGSTIATVSLKSAVKKPRLYYTCFVKLILLPVIMMAICLLLRTDTVISGVIILATACPTAAISTMFAIKFGKNAGYSAEIFAVTTLLSMLTLPGMLMLYEALSKII
ncbi:MAG: AEC family transporter [Ruminiclostridium sp.]|nr:AEC family transporter [Ruminiclostridium sp.]